MYICFKLYAFNIFKRVLTDLNIPVSQKSLRNCVNFAKVNLVTLVVKNSDH